MEALHVVVSHAAIETALEGRANDDPSPVDIDCKLLYGPRGSIDLSVYSAGKYPSPNWVSFPLSIRFAFKLGHLVGRARASRAFRQAALGDPDREPGPRTSGIMGWAGHPGSAIDQETIKARTLADDPADPGSGIDIPVPEFDTNPVAIHIPHNEVTSRPPGIEPYKTTFTDGGRPAS